MSVWNAKQQFCRAQRARANYYEAFGEVMEFREAQKAVALPFLEKGRRIQRGERNSARA
jgi:hypothetical protein